VGIATTPGDASELDPPLRLLRRRLRPARSSWTSWLVAGDLDDPRDPGDPAPDLLRNVGVQYMHISDPRKRWLRRIEGRDKEIVFTKEARSPS